MSAFINRVYYRLWPTLHMLHQRKHHTSTEQQLQKAILSNWLIARAQNLRVFENVKDAGFRVYSQYEEDGIILYLLAMVGMKTRTVVEMCCGIGHECMASNLIVNHGFKGFLFDGNERNVAWTRRFFAHQRDCFLVAPEVRCAWITKSNVNDLLVEAGVAGEVDLLSLDLDGNDYHIWEAIEVIQPRVCVFETHSMIPIPLALTVPYSDEFDAMSKPEPDRDFRSVSLAAMDKLSRRKGYTLVGSHKYGFNVFYVRNDLLTDLLPTPSLEEVHADEWTRRAQSEKWPVMKDYPWIEV